VPNSGWPRHQRVGSDPVALRVLAVAALQADPDRLAADDVAGTRRPDRVVAAFVHVKRQPAWASTSSLTTPPCGALAINARYCNSSGRN
jgi:hypothetical protein